MEFYSRASAILAFLSGAKQRIGLHRFNSEGPYRGDLLTHRIQYNPYLHTAVQYHLLVEAIWSNPAQVPMMKVPPPPIDAGDYEPPRFQATDEDRTRCVKFSQNDLASNLPGPLCCSIQMPAIYCRCASGNGPFCRTGSPASFGQSGALHRDHRRPSEQSTAEAVAAGRRIVSPAWPVTRRFGNSWAGHAGRCPRHQRQRSGAFSSLTDIDAVVLFGPEHLRFLGRLAATRMSSGQISLAARASMR